MNNKNVQDLRVILESRLDDMVDKNLVEQIKELEQKFSEIKLRLDPQVAQTFEKMGETFKKFSEYISSSFAEIQTNFFVSTLSFATPLIEIDLSGVKERLKARLEEYELLMRRYDLELWAIDSNLFDCLVELDDIEEPPAIEVIEQFIESKLDSYMKGFTKTSIYNNYLMLLEQSYSAFKSGQFVLASFPLFAVIEGIVSSAFKVYEVDVNAKPMLKNKKDKLYFKLSDYVESKEDELAVNMIFFRRVFNVYSELFQPSWDRHPNQINRNWMMHGSYEYARVTKTDVIKLFQLIKALEVVDHISFEKPN